MFDWKKVWTQTKNMMTKSTFGIPNESRLLQLIGSDGHGQYTYTDGKRQYSEVDIIYAATDMVASNFSAVNLVVKEVSGSGKQRKVSDKHPLQVLLNRPNWRQDQKSWLYAVAAYRILGGDSFTFLNTGIDPSDYSAPSELWQMGKDRWSVECFNGKYTYVYTPSGTDCINFRQTEYPVDISAGQTNVIQWSAFNPDSILSGISPLSSANINTGIYEAGNLWNLSYFKRGCRPSLALIDDSEHGMSRAEIDDLRKELDEVFSGLQNGNGRPMLLGKLKPAEMSTNPKDSDFIQSHNQAARDIAKNLRISPILISIGEDATFSNLEIAKTSMWTDCVLPMIEDYVRELNTILAPRYGNNITITIDTSHIQALEPIREKMWQRANDATFITLNERRYMTGMDPIVGGDVILVPSSMVPLDVLTSLGGGLDDTGN